MKILNFGLIIGIIALIVMFVRNYLKKINFAIDDFDEFDFNGSVTIEDLIKIVTKSIKDIMKKDIRNQNLTKDEMERKRKNKAKLNMKLHSAAYGDIKAKQDIKFLIKDIITSDPKCSMDEENIDDIIPFENEDLLPPYYKFLILLIMYKEEYGTHAFLQLVNDYNWLKPVMKNGKEKYDVTEERVKIAFSDYISKHELTYAHKLEVLVQRIFEKTYGFGAIDLLLEMEVDEIDAGVSGIPKTRAGQRMTAGLDQNIHFTYQAIWVLCKGINMQLSCIGFDSQPDLIRTCKNIYKYNTTSVLNRDTGKVIASMQNGNRVVVMQPPFCSTYAICVRKFDTVSALDPEKLYSDIEGFDIFVTMLKWMILGQRNIMITGEQACGKTTFMKSFMTFFAGLNLRIFELAFELELCFAYPDFNIISFQETPTVKTQDALDFSKKTNGGVNVIGEVSTAAQLNYFIQTKKRGSRQALASHHANTTDDLLTSSAADLLDPVCGIYNDKRDAIETCADAINIDCHLVNEKGNRHPERITEVIPIKEKEYPFEKGDLDFKKNAFHFMKNMTDRKQFDCMNLVEYHDGRFVLTNMPSEKMSKDICYRLSVQEEAKYKKDMERIKALSEKIEAKYRKTEDLNDEKTEIPEEAGKEVS